jgi:hypothetical protein
MLKIYSSNQMFTRFEMQPFLQHLPSFQFLDSLMVACCFCEPIYDKLIRQPGRAFYIDIEMIAGLCDNLSMLMIKFVHLLEEVNILRKIKKINI